MMIENKDIIAENYATVKKDELGKWACFDEIDIFADCIKKLESGTRIKVIVIKQN